MDDRKLLYTPENIPELEIAYAVTVHKSQGSEFCRGGDAGERHTPQALLPQPAVYWRDPGKAPVHSGGAGATVQRMVENVRQNLRYSCLADLLQHGGEQ